LFFYLENYIIQLNVQPLTKRANTELKITLVNPPYPPNVHSHPPFIPLGLAYLGAVAEKEGHEVNVIDCQAEKLTNDLFRQRISKENPDIIGVTATTLLYKSSMQLINIAKEVHPQAVTMPAANFSLGLVNS